MSKKLFIQNDDFIDRRAHTVGCFAHEEDDLPINIDQLEDYGVEGCEEDAAAAALACMKDAEYEEAQTDQCEDEEEGQDLQNYKGIYFNDEPGQKYICPETGAHFEVHDMAKRLAAVQEERK